MVYFVPSDSKDELFGDLEVDTDSDVEVSEDLLDDYNSDFDPENANNTSGSGSEEEEGSSGTLTASSDNDSLPPAGAWPHPHFSHTFQAFISHLFFAQTPHHLQVK